MYDREWQASGNGQISLLRCPNLPSVCLFINAVYQSLNVAVIKRIAAFGAELRRLDTLFGFPSALVALVLRNTCGFLCAAFGAELTLVDSTAGAGPAFIRRLR